MRRRPTPRRAREWMSAAGSPFSDRVTGLSRDDGTHLFTRVSPFGVSVAPRTCRRAERRISLAPTRRFNANLRYEGLRCFASAGVVSAVAAVWSDVLSADHFGWSPGVSGPKRVLRREVVG